MRKYRLVAKKGEGTFSEVLKAQNVKDGRYHAIKCMKNRFESIDQVNNLREIQALRRLSPHEHVISLEEVLYDQPTGRLALVFELMDANLYELIKGRKHYLNTSLVKSYIWQLMKALDHMHKKGIFHRDIKPENILIESSSAEQGRGLKLADFGSCRGIYSKQPYTEYISTRWYRAPECLLTDGYYGPEMDLWGAGCVMFEITSLYPLFPGQNEVDQIARIHKVLGTPNAESLAKFKARGASHISFDFPPQRGVGIPQLVPHASADSIDLMVKLLKYNASERITAREAMRHPYFKDVREAEAKQAAEAKIATNGAGEKAASGSYEVKSVAPSENSSSNTGGKNLPSITGAGAQQADSQYAKQSHLLQQQPQYQQQQGAALKPSGNTYSSSIPNTTNSSLPPIISTMGAGGTGFSKFGNIAVANAAGGSMPKQTPPSMMPSSNAHKRRKKYKTNYVQQQSSQQQKARQANSENVMRAYGIAKSGTGAGAGVGYGGGGVPDGGGSKVLESGGSKYSIGGAGGGAVGAGGMNMMGVGAGAGAGAGGYYPQNRHYVKKN